MEKQERESIYIGGQSPGLCEIIKEKTIIKDKEKPKKDKKEVKIKTESAKKEEVPEKVINQITGKTVYESSSLKAKNAVLYIFNLALLILIICLIMRI